MGRGKRWGLTPRVRRILVEEGYPIEKVLAMSREELDELKRKIGGLGGKALQEIREEQVVVKARRLAEITDAQGALKREREFLEAELLPFVEGNATERTDKTLIWTAPGRVEVRVTFSESREVDPQELVPSLVPFERALNLGLLEVRLKVFDTLSKVPGLDITEEKLRAITRFVPKKPTVKAKKLG